SLDSQYYFNNQSRLRPYFTVGFGEMLWQKDNDLKTFQVNAGTGVHYKLTKKLAVQLDWRYYYSTQKSTAENNMAARLVYLLGDGES
ncbi:MAG: porin family protein, partial [Colwellia sp.]|nr:porin family protein [Colwellia sp.]